MSNAILRPQATVAQTMRKAHQLLEQDQVVSAEVLLRSLVERRPEVVEAYLLLADLAEQRGDGARAQECLVQARTQAPADDALALAVADKQMHAEYPAEAIETLAGVLDRSPDTVVAWLMLGDIFDRVGMHRLASMARLQGVQRGQASGQLLNQETTPLILQPVIVDVIAAVNQQRNAMVDDALVRARDLVGAAEMARVEHAMAAYLGRVDDQPRTPFQQPRFLFFPGLPDGPFHDLAAQSWASQLADAVAGLRADAVAGLQLDGAGQTGAPDQFFWHRGQRIDDSHARFPAISALTEQIPLYEVAGLGPSVRLSVLQPGTAGSPQHGISNTRLSLQLPLVVPPGCTLTVHGAPVHTWNEGAALLFDDTFRHEMANPAGQACVILRMDCWNPHLSPAEQVATRHVIETIAAYGSFPLRELRSLAQEIRGMAPA